MCSCAWCTGLLRAERGPLKLLEQGLDAIIEGGSPNDRWPKVRTSRERIARYNDAIDLIGSPDFGFREARGAAWQTAFIERQRQARLGRLAGNQSPVVVAFSGRSMTDTFPISTETFHAYRAN